MAQTILPPPFRLSADQNLLARGARAEALARSMRASAANQLSAADKEI
jgi:hypothetical protein